MGSGVLTTAYRHLLVTKDTKNIRWKQSSTFHIEYQWFCYLPINLSRIQPSILMMFHKCISNDKLNYLQMSVPHKHVHIIWSQNNPEGPAYSFMKVLMKDFFREDILKEVTFELNFIDQGFLERHIEDQCLQRQ